MYLSRMHCCTFPYSIHSKVRSISSLWCWACNNTHCLAPTQMSIAQRDHTTVLSKAAPVAKAEKASKGQMKWSAMAWSMIRQDTYAHFAQTESTNTQDRMHSKGSYITLGSRHILTNNNRHVRVYHVDRDRDDPQLREVMSQRPEGPSRGRRRRGP